MKLCFVGISPFHNLSTRIANANHSIHDYASTEVEKYVAYRKEYLKNLVDMINTNPHRVNCLHQRLQIAMINLQTMISHQNNHLTLLTQNLMELKAMSATSEQRHLTIETWIKDQKTLADETKKQKMEALKLKQQQDRQNSQMVYRMENGQMIPITLNQQPMMAFGNQPPMGSMNPMSVMGALGSGGNMSAKGHSMAQNGSFSQHQHSAGMQTTQPSPHSTGGVGSSGGQRPYSSNELAALNAINSLPGSASEYLKNLTKVAPQFQQS